MIETINAVVSAHVWIIVGTAFICGMLVSYIANGYRTLRSMRDSTQAAEERFTRINESVKKMEDQMVRQLQYLSQTVASTDEAVSNALAQVKAAGIPINEAKSASISGLEGKLS